MTEGGFSEEYQLWEGPAARIKIHFHPVGGKAKCDRAKAAIVDVDVLLHETETRVSANASRVWIMVSIVIFLLCFWPPENDPKNFVFRSAGSARPIVDKKKYAWFPSPHTGGTDIVVKPVFRTMDERNFYSEGMLGRSVPYTFGLGMGRGGGRGTQSRTLWYCGRRI